MKRMACIMVALCCLFSACSAFAEHVNDATQIIMYKGRAIRGSYSGNLENGKPHGFGVFYGSDNQGDFLYAGIWTDGKMTGVGKIIYYTYSMKISGTIEDGLLSEGIMYNDDCIMRIGKEDGLNKMTIYLQEGHDVFSGTFNEEVTVFSGVFYDENGEEYIKCVDMSKEVFVNMLRLMYEMHFLS